MHGLSSQSGYIHHSFVNPGYASYYSQPLSPGAGAPAAMGSYPVQHFSGGSHGNAYSGYPEFLNPYDPQAQNPVYPSYPAMPQSRDGRPSHTVIAFGFGGTMAVVRPNPEWFFDREKPSATFEVMELKSLIAAPAGLNLGGGVENKPKDELFRWVDARSASCSCEEADQRSHQSIPLLWGALKVGYEHRGMIRPSASNDQQNGAGAAMGAMILSANPSLSESCLNPGPGAQSMQATHMKVKGLLLSGKTQQALECAAEGHSWGLALMLAKQIGFKCFADTVAAMAYKQLVPGALRAFSLLAINRPAEEVFVEDGTLYTNIIQHWHEYLALVAANRSFADDDVITRFGDILWTYKQDVAAAHLCFLLVDRAEKFFQSEGGFRLQLIGADHRKNPRTFATPLAILRTELYEHVKAKGNPYFVLESLLPYKLIYATMLVENGQKEEALRYTRGLLKSLKSPRGSLTKLKDCTEAASDLEARLVHNLEDGKSYSSIAGRMLSNTFSYVKSSLPAPRLTRYYSSSSIPVEKESSGNKSPARSISLPELSTRENLSSEQSPGFLRRVGSSVFQTTASLITRNKQANETSELDRENPIVYMEVPKQFIEPEAPQKPPTGLSVQCSDYYSRCVNSFSLKEGSLVKALISPQLPPLFKRKPEQPRRVLEV